MSGKGASYVETKAGSTFVRDGKAFVRTRDGALAQVDPKGAEQLFAEGDYLPASAEDVAQADIKAANSTLGAKAKTFVESAAAGAIDAAQAPIALPLRANAALWGDADPMAGFSGRETVENAASLFGGAKNAITGKNQNAEAYGREYGANARARSEANPVTALAGNVAGSLAGGAALSGGAGAIGRAGAAGLGGGAAERAAAALTTGALEGAAYGQAQASEEAYLHNIPLTGEKLIAAMGWGAVLGGGVSLAAHGAGALLRRGSRGATPIDSPRLPGQLDEAPLDVATTAAREAGDSAPAGTVADLKLPHIATDDALALPSQEAVSAHSRQMSELAKQFPPSPEELDALKKYTWGYDSDMRAVQHGASDVEIELTNKSTTRGQYKDAKHVADARAAEKHLQGYLDRIPPADTPVVYRGLALPEAEALKLLNNDTITLGDAMASASLDPEIAYSFATPTPEFGDVGVILKLEQRSARGIQEFSEVPSQQELLIPKGAKFEVVGRFRDEANPNIYHVHAREIDPTKAVAAAATEAAPSRFSGGLRDFADERTAKALGARGSTLKKLGRTAEQAESTMHDMARTVRGVALDDGTPVFRALDSQEELSARVLQAKQETGAKLGAFRDKADKVFEAHPEIAPKADAIADRIAKEVAEPLEGHPLSAVRAQSAPIRQVVEDIRALGVKAANDNGKGIGVSDLTRLRQGLDDQIYQAKRGVNLTQQGAPPNLQDLQRARGILEESIEAASDKAATFFEEKAAQSYKEIKTQWRHLNLASDIAGAAELQNLGNRVVSPSDYGVGAAAGVLGGGPIGAVASAFAHKTIREHSSAVLAVLADKLANNLDGKIESGLGAFFRESTARGSASAAGLDRAASAVPLKRIITPAAVDAFTGRSKDLQAAYEKRVAELADAGRDMGAGVRASMQTAMGGGAETMPRLTQAATLTATRGAQYLESQLPSGTAAPTVFQPTRKVSPSDLQIREFAQKWAAVSNPLSVIDDLRRGTVTHAQIDALKTVYPELYAEVQSKALDKIRELDEQGKRMPFNDRLQLDLFLDLNGAGEPTLSGKFIDRVAGMQAAKAKQDATPKLPNSGAALGKIGVSRQSGAQGTFGG